MREIKYIIIFFIICVAFISSSQNETKKWCLANYVGIDFMTSPPTTFTHSSLLGGISMSDAAGNLELYGRGELYNGLHQAIPNSTYIPGWGKYGGLAVKQPGQNSIYYVFYPGVNGFLYLVVDLSLAANTGSVIMKDVSLNSSQCEWRVAAVKHCNGKDVWIMGHERFNNNFVAYLLTSNGISSTPVVSSIGSTYTTNVMPDCMKFSPSGKRLVTQFQLNGSFELFDFNTGTGVLSNLISINTANSSYDAEFSPDESKLYVTFQQSQFYEYNLCAGSQTAIVASQYTLGPNFGSQKYTIQMAENGKIYIARASMAVAVINTPNNYGAACNFIEPDPNLPPGSNSHYLPNFVASYFYHPGKPSSFSYVVSPNLDCQKVNFYAPPSPTNNCAISNYSVTGIVWDFGDPSSASSNISTLQNPVHTYSGPGTYTPTLIFNYECGADTLKQVVTIAGPSVQIVATSGDCYSKGSATVTVSGGTGPYSYTWMPSGQTNSVISNLSTGTYSVLVFDNGSPCYSTDTLEMVTIQPPVFAVTASPSIICNGNTTTLSVQGNASSYSVSSILGFSPVLNSQFTVSPASTQSYSVIGYLNSCSNAVVATVSVTSLPSASISISKNSVCVNEFFSLQGWGGSSYEWTLPGGGNYSGSVLTLTPTSTNYSGSYSLQITDTYGCKANITKQLVVKELPHGDILSSNKGGCVPFCTEFKFEFPPEIPDGIVNSWLFQDKLMQEFNDPLCFNTPGTYKLSAMIEDTTTGCVNMVHSNINAYPLPIADFTFTPEKPVEGFEDVQFQNTSKGEGLKLVNWYFVNNNGFRSSSNTPSFLFKERGVYPVAMIITNKWGCTDTIIKLVNVEADFNIYVPNTFTPDGNDLNEVFLPRMRGVKLYELYIFNRWGAKIFSTNDLHQGWDGSFKGEPCKEDIYVWKISLSTVGGETKELSGFVTLLR